MGFEKNEDADLETWMKAMPHWTSGVTLVCPE